MRLLVKVSQILVLLSCSLQVSAEQLRILCWEGYAPVAFTTQFEVYIKQKYDIDVHLVVSNVSDPQEFFSQIRGKQVDLISPAHNIPRSERWRFIDAGLVLPIDLDNVPNYQHIIPALQYADYITEQDKVYGVPIVYGPYGLAYNTAYFEEAPDSWSVFWEPKYAGRYSISADYHEANIYITALASAFNPQQIFDFETLKQSPEVIERLEQLSKNASSFWVGVDKANELSGLALATAWGFSFPELRKKGQIWKFAQPKEGTTGWVDNWMIGYSLKDKPMMKRIAEEWINFSIGNEMQVNYVRNIGQFPVNLSIAPELTEEEQKTYHLDEPDFFKNNLILWKVLPARYQNGFKLMWDKAKSGVKKPSENAKTR